MNKAHRHKCKICGEHFETEKLFDICMCSACQKKFNDPKAFLKSKTPYLTVEQVMALPVTKRWTYSKWWSQSESAKARAIDEYRRREGAIVDSSAINLKTARL